jgi:hypothetical protein
MGATETGVLARAHIAGIPLRRGERVPWLTFFGHLDAYVQEAAPAAVIDVLDRIFLGLGGDRARLAAKRPSSSPTPDARLGGQIVEIDEIQHFTSDRLYALRHYRRETQLGFDIQQYGELCRQWATRGDRYRAAKQSVDFPRPGGRRAQRAYFDACRDLLAPHLDGGPVIRVPAPECDAGLAYERLQRILTTRQAR